MERMTEVVRGSEYQALQHFISDSKWDGNAVMEQVAMEADVTLGGSVDSCLLLDETSFPKKGDKSVGVARQWCGRLGKVENCQVAVFACLSRGPHSALIDTRLYLPKKWTDSPERCLAAKVPKEHIVQRSKVELALEIVREARKRGVRFSWVGADGGYGKDPLFLRALDESGERFIVDVHKGQRMYLEDPSPFVPESQHPRGRKPSLLVSEVKSQRVDEWARRQSRGSWQRIHLRNGTKGVVKIEVLHRRVWVWDGKEEKARYWRLLISRELGGQKKLKYGLSNFPTNVSVQQIAKNQRQRFWIERSFQDAKSESGLGDYQARSWVAWHHHVALVMIAMQFMLEERLRQKDDHALLSCADIEELLSHFLPRKDVTAEEVIRQMEVRHQQRRGAIESAYRNVKPDKPFEMNEL